MLQSLVLGWSHKTLMESSELRDDRLWLCNIESSRNCNTIVRTCNGNGPEGVMENARNVTENVQNVTKNVRKVTKNVRKSNEKNFGGSRNLIIVGGRSNGKCSKCSENIPEIFGKIPELCRTDVRRGKDPLEWQQQGLRGGGVV